MNPSETKRIDTLDAVKGICIFLMICGHLSLNLDVYGRRFIYLFHMGCFFLVSGYFVKELSPFNIKNAFYYIFAKFKNYYFPFIKASLSVTLLSPILVKWHLFSCDTSWHEIIRKMGLALVFEYPDYLFQHCWFLKSLFFGIAGTICIVNLEFKSSE